MRKITWFSMSVLAATVLVVFALGCTGTARAANAPAFALANLNGNCAFRLVVNNGQTLTLVGEMAFDGNGNVDGSIAQNTSGGSGSASFQQFTGTYTANSDGTGTIAINAGSDAYNIAYAADAGPGILQWILTNSGSPGIGSCSF